MDSNEQEANQPDDEQPDDGDWPQGAPPEVDDLTPIGQMLDMPPKVIPVADIKPEGLGIDPFDQDQGPDGPVPPELGGPDLT